MESTTAPSRLDAIYQAIVNEEDARVCKDISEDACRVVPGNFLRTTLSQTLSNLGATLPEVE